MYKNIMQYIVSYKDLLKLLKQSEIIDFISELP
jgi:hypothetical protein